MHLYYSMPKPVVFGHRGASRYAPENTIAAFDLAIQQGAKAFELDTMLSRDGIPVVIHDHTLERTTNGSGEVNQKTAEELQKLDAGSHFSSKYKGEKIPLLEDVLKRYTDDVLINIELKNYQSPGDNLARIALEMVRDMDQLERVIFSSFLPSNLWILRSLNRRAKTALLTPGGAAGTVFRSFVFRWLSPEMIHPPYQDVSQKYVEKEHRHSRHINTWTVDDLEAAQKLIDWGVDGLITDDPKGILNLL